MRLFLAGTAAFALMAGTAMAQEKTIIVESKTVIVYERVIIAEAPTQLATLSTAARATADIRCDKSNAELPDPYFCFVKGTADNMPASMHHLLGSVSSKGRMLCGTVKNAYALAARQWNGNSDLVAAGDIADRLGGTPCGFSDNLVLSNFHFSLRTAFDPSRGRPSWVVAWQDQYERWHFYAYKAPRSVLASVR